MRPNAAAAASTADSTEWLSVDVAPDERRARPELGGECGAL